MARTPPSGMLAAFLALALALVAGEAAVGRWLQSPSAAVLDPRFGLIHRPHARVVQSLEGWSVARTNSHGFFDTELRPVRPPLRVLLLGDSYAEALQVRPEENFSRVAERLVPDAEVVNCGGSGRFPAHYAAQFRAFVERYRPDMVYVQVNDGDVNEMGDASRLARVRAGSGAADGAADGAPGTTAAAAPAALAGRLRDALRHSALAKFTMVRLSQLQEFESRRFRRKFSNGPIAEDINDTALPEHPRARGVADSLFAAMKAEGVPIVIVYIPFVDYFSDPPAAAYPHRAAFWHALARRQGLELLDPTDAYLEEFRRSGQALHGFSNSKIGWGHLNARGHAVLGRLIAADLERRLP